MCTVVVQWEPGRSPRVLALRDELVGRAFDPPAAHWPEQPTVIGGRDLSAGGTWCATDVATGRTALVLNRPQRRVAAAGAPSRGVLPLAALAHGAGWPAHVDTSGMASFALVTVDASGVRLDEYDGHQLTSSRLAAGVHMVTSGGAEDGKATRHLRRFADTASDDDWIGVLDDDQPSADLTALCVRVELESATYATVFGQLITAAPGRLSLRWSRTPWVAAGWHQELVDSADAEL